MPADALAGGLEIEALALRRGAFSVQAGFRAPSRGITVLFGPSGAGKSLLLSAIAGLSRIEGGTIRLDGEVLCEALSGRHVPAHRRGVGLVFQDARLFPHLSVRDNILFSARRSGHEDPARLAGDAAARLGLGELLPRAVRALSGGERSRVALARALASAPRFLLLDEPFAALDGRRRRAYLALLREIAVQQRLPMLVVTHAVEDAAELADHVVLMQAGKVTASGDADAVMNGAALQALLDPRDQGARVVGAALGSARSASAGGRGAWVRADAVMLSLFRPEGISARHVWPCTIKSLTAEEDSATLLALQADSGPLLARITAESAADLKLRPGMSLFAMVKTHAL